MYFEFGLLFLRSEQSEPSVLGNFWVSLKFAFVRIFWIWFVVFVERAERTEPTRKLLGLFEFWVFLKFGFVRIFLDWFFFAGWAKRAKPTRKLLGLFEFWVYSKFGFISIFWIWFVVFAERTEPTRKLLGFFRILGLFLFFGFVFFAGSVKRVEPTRKFLGLFQFWVYSKFGFISIFWIWFVVFAFSGRIIYVYSSDIRTKSQSLVKKYIFCLYSCLKTIVFKLLVGFWICSFYWLIFLLYVMCYFLVFFSPYFFDTCYSDMWPSLPYLYKVVSKFVNNSRGHF